MASSARKRGAFASDESRRFRRLDKSGRPTGPLLHGKVGQELIKKHHACFIDGAPAIWNGCRYATGWDEIDRVTIRLVNDAKISEQNEVRHYLHLEAPERKSAKPSLIAFENGVLDLDGGMKPLKPNLLITNIIPHSYDDQAHCTDVDMFLDRASNGNPTVRQNLEEVIGVCMYRASDYGQCPVLIGDGSNGKSTFIHALRNVLGSKNVSSLDINVLGMRFYTGQLLGKLANLGDDISNERLTGNTLSIFKKIVTGEQVFTDVKNGHGFEFKPYCTLVFSCNEFPRIGDSSEGMMRRLFPIPFSAHFTPMDEDYDPRMRDKLTTPTAAQYLIKLGIDGLKRVRKNNRFTPTEQSARLVHNVQITNDSVLQWIEDAALIRTAFADRVISECYAEYRNWCASAGTQPCSKSKFTRRVNKVFDLESVPMKREFADAKRSVRVFRETSEANIRSTCTK